MENNTEDSKNQQEQQEKKTNELTIKIRRFQNLLDILNKPKKVIVLSFAIALIGILLFGGITFIVLSIKRLYPYNDITTNAMGTTTLKSENKNVSYFLLNSAELWANSGIQVKKGQTITIKSSGKKHSAIHHLLDNAQNNKPILREPWVGTEGFPSKYDPRGIRDRHRAKYRIFPQNYQDVLIMQIVKEGAEPIDRPQIADSDHHFIVIGNKLEQIHIGMDGTLYFAVNDIVLDDATIIKMLIECDSKYDKICEEEKNYIVDTLCNSKRLQLLRDSMLNEKDAYNNKTLYQSFLDAMGIELNKKEIVCDTITGIDTVFYKKAITYGPCKLGTDPSGKFIELYGYYMYKYKEVWYEDNVGSFLILVETVNE